jgi:ABC-type multidrug transport system fused ATPase/permease subunit
MKRTAYCPNKPEGEGKRGSYRKMLIASKTWSYILHLIWNRKMDIMLFTLSTLFQMLFESLIIVLTYLVGELGANINNVWKTEKAFAHSPLSFFNKSLNGISGINQLPHASQYIIVACAALLIASAGSALAKYMSNIASAAISAKTRKQSVRFIHGAVMDAPFSQTHQMSSAELTKISSDASHGVDATIQSLIVLANNALIGLAYVVSLISISPFAFAAVGLTVSVLLGIQKIVTPRLIRGSIRIQECELDLTTQIDQDITNKRLVAIYSAQELIKGIIIKLTNDLTGLYLRQARLTSVTEPLASFMPVLILVVLLTSLILFNPSRDSQNSFGVILAFGIALQRLNGKLLSITQAANGILSYTGQRQQVRKILALARENESLKGPTFKIADESSQYIILLDRVSYRYEASRKDALSEVTIRIKKGGKVALVGESGCGKSTVLDTMAGIINPTSGVVSVSIDNVMDRFAYGQKIAMVTQDSLMVSGSVRDNLNFGNERIIEEQEYWELLSRVRLDSYFKKYQEGLDYYLGRGASNLSGGQKQRLCIARALARRPVIMLMDEATSSLDSKTANYIMHRILRESSMTVICSTHRLTDMEGYDNIVLIQNGSVADQGTHASLIANNAKYRELYSIYHSDIRGNL